MKQFNYTAKTSDGQLLREVIEAGTRQHALSELRRKGLTVVSLMEQEGSLQGATASAPRAKAGYRLRKKEKDLALTPKKSPKSKKIRINEMAIFCRQLSVSVNSGLSLREALEGIHEDMNVPALKRVLGYIIKQLHDGVPFSKAVAQHPKIFSPVFIGMVRAAEEAGSLSETLDQLANYMEANDKLQRKIKSLMAYPIFVAIFFALICLVMVLGIIPRFQEIFGSLGSELPRFTQAIFSVNAFLVTNSLYILGGVLLVLALYTLYRNTALGALQVDRLKLRLPLSGSCLKRYIVARICRCLAIMLKSGVPVSTALAIVAKIGDNRAIEKAIREAHQQILSGSSIANGLEATGIFPALLIRMMGVGESAGRLPEVLGKVSDAYEDQVEGAITTSTALLEPIIISVFGMMVLLLIVSIYLPVFNVAAQI